MPSTPENNNTYFSIEAPHKPRRRSYFWTIFISLSVLAAALVAGVTFQQHNSNTQEKHQTLLSKPSNGFGEETSNEKPEFTTQSYQANMDKTTWPELVGKDGAVAKETILQENPGIKKVQIIPKDSFVSYKNRVDG